MHATTGITFAVSEVERATQPLPEADYRRAVCAFLSAPLRHRLRELRWLTSRPVGEAYPGQYRDQLAECERAEAEASRRVEACSRYHGRLVADVCVHPVIAALHRAFQDHRPVSLSPDMAWLMICQGAAHHVNAHAEELRPRLVAHEGKTDLAVRRDDFFKGSPENPWAEVVADLSAQVREHVGPALDLFTPDFSTTGPAERAAAGIVLLDAVAAYFTYEVVTLCGIPAVTLEGSAEDWEAVAGRAQGFAHFGLGWWLEGLTPVLRRLADTARGRVDRSFWQSIYKYHSFSGGASVTGWITAFFPYLKDGRGNPTVLNRWLAAGGPGRDRLLAGGKERGFGQDGPAAGTFPQGLSCAPFVWQYFDQRFDMEFLGGFVGVAQDPETLCLRPEIGWAVRERG